MKHFLIKYRFKNGSAEDWHRQIGRFIAALDADPALKGKVSYRCMKAGDGGEYYHIATVTDDAAGKTVQSRDYFARYKEKMAVIAGGTVETMPLEIVGETAHVA